MGAESDKNTEGRQNLLGGAVSPLQMIVRNGLPAGLRVRTSTGTMYTEDYCSIL